MRQSYKKHIVSMCIVLNIVCFVTYTFSQGFAAGTLVKVPDGYIPIEQMQSGDYVLAFARGAYVPCKVLRALSVQEEQYCCVQVQGNITCMSLKQKLYVSGENRWVTAQDIQVGDMLIEHAGERYTRYSGW